jgi:hypothetical protein
MAARLSHVSRWLPWFAAMVLTAGIVAVIVVAVGGRDSTSTSEKPLPPPEAAETVLDEPPPPPLTRLDPKAQQVAGRFILTAVARENLRDAWEISGADIRQGLTLKQWLTGNIPVPYFPADAIDEAPLRIAELKKNSALLEVAILPKKGTGVKGQLYHIGLKAAGKGKQRRWVVTYFQPSTTPPFPVTPDQP